MKKKLIFEKGVALALSALMLLGTVPNSAFASQAESDTAAVEESADEESAEASDEAELYTSADTEEESSEAADSTTEQVTEDTSVSPESGTGEAEETNEETTDAEATADGTGTSDTTTESSEDAASTSSATEETTSEETSETSAEEQKFTGIAEDSAISEEELGNMDFSSKRLLISGDIIDPENELSSYEGIHLMQYDSENTAMYAYSYYYGKVAFVSVDSTVSVAIGEESAAGSSEMTAEENPLAELGEADPVQTGSNVIALIDTGAGEGSNVTSSVSMLGDDASDENGHGTKMVERITEANPDAQIISIKALGADGTGDISSVYAGIEYAIESDVDIINLSFSSSKNAESAAIASIISEAEAKGIKVVAAAGNNSADASYYIPGGLDGVITIGAADETGKRIASSNYGDCVEYNVVADSTSEAAAIYSGLLSAGKGDADKKLVFPVDYSVEEGPNLRHQITFYDYENDSLDLDSILLVAAREDCPTTIEDGYIKSQLFFSEEDVSALKEVEVFTDFMDVEKEVEITDECKWDAETLTMSIPEKYKDANLTIRWYMSNASYMYGLVADNPVDNTPEKYFHVSEGNQRVDEFWNDPSAYDKYFDNKTYEVDSSDFDTFNVGDTFTATKGYVYMSNEKSSYTADGETLKFYNSFTRVYNSKKERAEFLENIGKSDTRLNMKRNWVYGSCVKSQQSGETPVFAKADIKCIAKDETNRTATFAFVVESSTAQWNAGCFTIKFKENSGWLWGIKKSSCKYAEDNDRYSMKGLAFIVYENKACTKKAKDVNGDPAVLVIGYNDDYKDYQSQKIQLKVGKYWVQEADVLYKLDDDGIPVATKTPISKHFWTQNEESKGITITKNHTHLNDDIKKVTIINTPDSSHFDPINILLKKIDKTTGKAVAQGNGSLAGAQFTVSYYDNLTATGTPKATWVFQTDEKGYIKYIPEANGYKYKISGPDLYQDSNGRYGLPTGSYSVKEKVAPTGYKLRTTKWKYKIITPKGKKMVVVKQLNDDGTETLVSSTTTVGNYADLSVQLEETSITGGVSFQKVDAETGKAAAQGTASLKGAKIAICNESDAAVTVNGKSYEKGEKCLTLTTDAKGKCSTANNALPYGTYKAVEEEASAGYTLNEDWSVTFQIRENGTIVDTSSADAKVKTSAEKSGWTAATGNTASAAQLPEQVKRADLSLTKMNEKEETMANIPFLVELLDANGDVAESHVIVTDENGSLNTAERPKTGDKVNCLDSYEENGIFTDESQLTANTGVWFGAAATEKSGTGSLVYGNYRITELSCAANKGDDLLAQELFTVNTPGDLFINGQNYTMDAFVDLPVDVKSTLLDDATETNAVTIGKETSVTDTVSYTNLKTTSKYRLATDIYYVTEDGTATKLGSTSQDFSPEKDGDSTTAGGTLENTVTVDTSDMAENSKLCAVDTIYRLYNNRVTPITAHNEDCSVESQTLYHVSLSTQAKDSETGDNVGTVTENASVIDTVVYRNLVDGRSYTLEGTLRYADSGETVLDKKGNPCVVTKEITVSKDVKEAEEKDGKTIVPLSGKIEMPAFSFDASDLGDKTLVVTETLTDTKLDKVIVDHNDLTDEGQSIHYVKVETKASDVNTGSNTAVVGTTTIADEVTMTNLIVGREYTVSGDLVYQTDCTDSKGEEHKKGDVIATHEPVTFTAEDTTNVITLNYEVDASALAGLSGVVFEDVYHNDIKVAQHHDYESQPQTPNWPSVKTTAVDKTTGSHTGVKEETATIVDTVKLTNLTEGDSYYVEGTLMTSEGEEFLVNGEKVTSKSETFTAEEKDTTLEVEFSFNASELEGQSLVVYEKLIQVGTDGKETEVAGHEDKNDQGQTVDFPVLHTNAADGQTKDHVGTVGKTTIVDTVSYESLHVGEEYTITGNLHYQTDFTDTSGTEHKAGDTLLDADGKEITASVTFTAEKASGTQELTYEVDASLLAGAGVVVFEDLYNNDVQVYSHADLNDENQTVEYPDVKTTALDSKTKTHMGSIGKKAELVDTVKLTNLIVGQKYTVSGTLMDAETEKVVTDSKGEAVTGTSGEFEATETEMTVEVTFTVDDASLMYGRTTVVFEDLLHNDVTVAYHKDLTDKDQTVEFPEIGTTATDKATGNHIGHLGKEITIVDEVKYSGLLEGKDYTVSGVLMNKETGKALKVNGKKVTAEKTFTAEASEGSVELEFTFNSTALAGTNVVAFETVKYNDITVAVHKDLTDKDQTVEFPKIGTTATDKSTGKKTMTLGNKVTLVDTVSYTGLKKGETYKVKGEVYDKSTGKTTGVTASATFKAEASTGKTTVEFTLNTNNMKGKSLVVFEEVYDAKGNLVAEHKDLSDKDQTVTVPNTTTVTKTPGSSTTTKNVKTGDTTNLAIWFGIIAVCAAGLGAIVYRKRKEDKAE